MDAKCKSAGRPAALAVLLALCLLLPAGMAPGQAGTAFTAAQPSSVAGAGSLARPLCTSKCSGALVKMRPLGGSARTARTSGDSRHVS